MADPPPPRVATTLGDASSIDGSLSSTEWSFISSLLSFATNDLAATNDTKQGFCTRVVTASLHTGQ
jgi:hypothetical protein